LIVSLYNSFFAFDQWDGNAMTKIHTSDLRPSMLSAEESRQQALELQLWEMQRDDKIRARESKKTREAC
jgi:hypothetical protein